MKDFKTKAAALRRKMSECAFDQSGEGPNPIDLLAKALEKAYSDGITEGVIKGIGSVGTTKKRN